MICATNDGGRADAGFRGQTRDCVCRAIAIATELPYEQVYVELRRLAKAHDENPRTGLVFSEVITGRITSLKVVVMARALADERGNFLGVVFAPVEA